MESLIESLDGMISVYYAELEKLKIWKEENLNGWVDELQNALGDYNNWKPSGNQFLFSYSLTMHAGFKCFIDTAQILSEINEKLKLRGLGFKLECNKESGGDTITMYIHSNHMFDAKTKKEYELFNDLKKQELLEQKKEHERRFELALKTYQDKEKEEYNLAKKSIDKQVDETFEKFKFAKYWRIDDRIIPECMYIFRIPINFKDITIETDLKNIAFEKVKERFSDEYDNRFELTFYGYACRIRYAGGQG